jgi:tellurite resistance protein TehA-like permease/glutaredoxin
MSSPDSTTPGLVVFVTASCPFCWRVKSLFSSLGLAPEYVDAAAHPERYKDAVEKTGHLTLPLVMHGDKAIGGCDDTCIEAASGQLQRRFNLPTLDTVPTAERRPVPSIGLFHMPAIVNRWVVQFTGIQVVVLCAIIIGFRNNQWSHWLCFGLSMDFIVRTIFGGFPSPLGAVATFLSAPITEELVPGAPKQFASAIGIFMTGFATILFFTEQIVGGCVVIGVLAGFAALEGFFNFCFGCYIYSWLNVFGIVPNDVYKPYTDSLGFVWAGLNDLNTRLGWQEPAEFKAGTQPVKGNETFGWREKYSGTALPRPVSVHVAVPEGRQPGELDYTYKFPKSDDITREKWSAAYVQFSDFGMVLGIAGFALAVRAATESPTLYVQPELWQFFAIMAAAIFGILLLCLLFKLIFHPRKILMDLRHPVKRATFAIIPICFLVFSGLANKHDKWLQSTMWWAGAPLILAHLVLTLATLVKDRHAVDHLTPALLFPAAGNLVVAVVTPAMAAAQPWTGNSFMEAAYWYWGVGFLFFIILLATTMFHGFSYHWSDERMRPMCVMWGGACFIAVLAYMNVNKMLVFDSFCFVFFCSGTILMVTMIYLGLSGWLISGKFELSFWGVGFPLDVAAVCACRYFNSQKNAFSQGIFWMFITMAGWANFVLLFHTLHALAKRRFPTPPTPFGPLAFNKLQHDAFREILLLLSREIAEPAAPDGDSAESAECRRSKVDRIRSMLTPFFICQDTHAKYEDTIMFDELGSLWPDQLHAVIDQHATISSKEEAVKKHLAESNLEGLVHSLPGYISIALAHMQDEEDHLTPMIRKYINSKMQIDLLRRIWDSMPLSEMEVVIVTTVRYLPFHAKRVRYLKAITWALPERAQQIGLWLYRGLGKDPLGDIKYAYIIDSMPELAPRNSGFKWVRFV